MRMTSSEAAAFALVLGFTSGIVMLAGLVVRPGQNTETAAEDEQASAPAAESGGGESGPSFGVRVRDVSGAGIGGAKVRLASRNGRGAASLERRTDDHGEASFPSLTQDEYELRVTQSGFATLKRTVAPATEAARRSHVDVVLRGADRTLAGRVVDADGAAVAGLRIVASAPDPENAASITYQVTSAAGGAFELSGVPDLLFELTVAPDQAEQLRLDQPVSSRPDGGDVVLRLARRATAREPGGGTRVTGLVRSAAGIPISEVDVQLTSLAGPGARRGQRCLTNEQGAFLLADVAPGSYRVTAGKVDYTTSTLTVEVGALREQVLAPIDLRRGGEITATITDQRGRPLPSVPVRVIGSEASFNLVYRTAQDGTIHATGLPEGKYLVKVAMAAGAAREVFLRDGERASVSLAQ